MNSSLLGSVRMLPVEHLTALQLPDWVIAMFKIGTFMSYLLSGWDGPSY